jgi:hypothetical protein
VNESTWEHLRVVFWPGVLFMLIEFTYVKDSVQNYFIAKTASLFLMPFVITVGWYAYTPFTGRSIFPLDLVLFYVAVLIDQVASYRLLTAPPLSRVFRTTALVVFLVLLVSFSVFTFYPPPIFLCEHFHLLDTGQYGILGSYDGLRVSRQP